MDLIGFILTCQPLIVNLYNCSKVILYTQGNLIKYNSQCDEVSFNAIVLENNPVIKIRI